MKLQNIEHELTLLSQLISDTSLLDDYKILDDFFTTVDNKAIFNAIKSLKEKGYDVDYISVCDESKVTATGIDRKYNEPTIWKILALSSGMVVWNMMYTAQGQIQLYALSVLGLEPLLVTTFIAIFIPNFEYLSVNLIFC